MNGAATRRHSVPVCASSSVLIGAEKREVGGALYPGLHPGLVTVAALRRGHSALLQPHLIQRLCTKRHAFATYHRRVVFDMPDVAAHQHHKSFHTRERMDTVTGEGLWRKPAQELGGELAIDCKTIGGKSGGLSVIGKGADEGGLIVIHEQGSLHAGDALHAVAALDIAIPEVDDILVDGP